MTKDNNGINHTSGEEYRSLIDYHWDLGHGWSEELL